MPSRREFLGALSWPVAAAMVPACAMSPRPGPAARVRLDELRGHSGTPAEIARDESYWFAVQQSFTVDRSLLNLNNGGVSPSPAIVQDAMKGHLDFSNEAPSHHLWRVLEPRKETVRTQLARLFGCDREEMAIVRNASEGLQICEFGFDLEPGDEVLTTTQDYPRMISTWRQREMRDGIRLVQVSIPTPCDDPSRIVSAIAAGITERTRVILVSHVVNLTGQVLPVRAIVAKARERGIPVIVDGAHAFANLTFTRDELDCDYYATSLHKWLFAPHGTGMLYVRRNKIRDLWPLMASAKPRQQNIRKFEEIGTHPLANFLAIAEAVTFHETLGAERKEARLLYLRDTWAKRLARLDRVRLHTSLEPGMACGIATVEIEGIDTSALNGYLFREHRIITTGIGHEEFSGLRVSPSVYTTLDELDRFCEVMEHVVQHGIPKRA